MRRKRRNCSAHAQISPLPRLARRRRCAAQPCRLCQDSRAARPLPLCIPRPPHPHLCSPHSVRARITAGRAPRPSPSSGSARPLETPCAPHRCSARAPACVRAAPRWHPARSRNVLRSLARELRALHSTRRRARPPLRPLALRKGCPACCYPPTQLASARQPYPQTARSRSS